MSVYSTTATVYFGGRRRWFSLDAACRAEAKLRFKQQDDDNDDAFEVRVPELAEIARSEYDEKVGQRAPDAPEARALAACRELVAATSDARRLTTLIGDSIRACCDAWQEKRDAGLGDNKPDVRHLETAYAFESDDDGDRTYLTPAEQIAILGACPHCLAAHNAIQERKAARRRLGAARRAITMIGKQP